MKYFLRTTFLVALIALTGTFEVYGVMSLSGSGGIDFNGTGTITHMQVPFIVNEVYNVNCIPSPNTNPIIVCREPLDTTLLGNDIVRADQLRVQASLGTTFFSLTFGCSACGTSVVVFVFDMIPISGGSFNTVLRLPNDKAAALQALIDQFGAGSIHIKISLSGGPLTLFSSVRAVDMDIKPGSSPNTMNLRSRGVTPIALLTTPDFDATTIDIASLRFGATGTEVAAMRGVFEDVDGDGDIDLLVFFRGQDTGIDCDTLFTYISGSTLTGDSIAGTDSVAIVACH